MVAIRRTAAGFAAAVALAVVAVALAACGGSSNSGTGTTASKSASADNPAVASAKAEYAKYVKQQPAIDIPALPSKPPAGKTVTIETCPLPVCKSETDPAVAAAKKLGWKVTYLQSALTPASYQTTVNQILANPTQLVAITPVVPNSFIDKQLAAFGAKRVPVVEIAPAGDLPSPNGPVLAAVTGPPSFGQSGRLMGDAVVADGGAGAKAVFVWDPSLASIWSPIKDNFTRVVQGAGGSVDVLKVNQMDIGKAIPNQVVSYVQAHPDVRYVAFALDDLDTGVAQALDSAGVAGQVKILSRAPQPANLANIKAGREWLSIAEENVSAGYRAVDQLARIVMGVDLGNLRNPAGWAQILTKDNIASTSAPPTTPGYPDVFLKAWHLQ